jgi:CBS domain-containing protein
LKQNEPVSKIMSTGLKTIQIGQKLSDARRILAEKPFDHVPVLDGTKLVGMLSSTDLVKLTFDWGNSDARSIDAVLDHQFTVAGTMTKDLVTMKSTETVRQAAQLLVQASHHAVPVVEGDAKLVGIVTSTDLIRYLLDQY